MNLRTFLLSAAASLSLPMLAGAADPPAHPTLDPGVTYTDKVVGSTEVADPARIQTDDLQVNAGPEPTPDLPRVQVKATHVLKAGAAHADIIERTTIWTAGNFNAANAFWAPIAVADPFFWLDPKSNPIALAQHVAADQRIRRTMTFTGAPTPDQGSVVQDFSAPAAHISLFVEARPPISTGFFVETDADGRWSLSVRDLARLLAGSRAGGDLAPRLGGRPIRLQIFPVSEPDKGVAVTVPPALLSQASPQ